jgi:hypothetical protein
MRFLHPFALNKSENDWLTQPKTVRSQSVSIAYRHVQNAVRHVPNFVRRSYIILLL